MARSELKRHVLVVAYTARPQEGSESGAGWAYVRAAAQQNAVTVFVRSQDAEILQNWCDTEDLRHIRVIPVAIPRRLPIGIASQYLQYLGWNLKVARLARRLEDDVDVAHHVTYGIDWLPSGAHLLRHTPVVWGPVGSYAPFPFGLRRYLPRRALLRELGRVVATSIARRVTLRLIRSRTALTVCANRDVARALRRMSPSVVEPQVALDEVPISRLKAHRRTQVGSSQSASPSVRRAIFVARLQACKGPYLALAALRRMPPEWRLEFYGEGPERERLEAAVAEAGLSDRVGFHGMVAREAVAAALQDANVLLFPSMHDASGFAVAEALAVGCPVVCLDIAGPALLVEGQNGIAVTPSEAAEQELAEAMLRARRGPPSRRWHADRLLSTVESWYSRVQSMPGAANRS